LDDMAEATFADPNGVEAFPFRGCLGSSVQLSHQSLPSG